MVEFKIEHIDALGQGVSKTGDNITFIAKSLPGETGIAKIQQSKKGVQFAKIEKIENLSPERVIAECQHYKTCTGCHFLHTNYQNELTIKFQNFKRIFRKYPESEFTSIGAPERLGYRNRLQLHYDFNEKKLGFVNQLTHEIVEVPECLVGTLPLRQKLTELYHKGEWLHHAKNQKTKGHVELYQKGDGVSLTWNQAYSDGGFTQVNRRMNEVLVETVSANLKKYHDLKQPLLDLFAGNGNLTKEIANQTEVSCVDFHASGPVKGKSQEHFHADLYHPMALKNFQSQGKDNYSTLVLDPPRSGFKNLKDWSDKYNFKFIFYVSCNPNTLIRDLESVDQTYTIKHLYLLDLFPSTYHFETIALLIRKS